MTAGNTVNVKVNEKASAGSKPLVAQKFFFELLKKAVHEFCPCSSSDYPISSPNG